MCVCYYLGAATAFNASARLLVSYFPLAHAILTKGKSSAPRPSAAALGRLEFKLFIVGLRAQPRPAIWHRYAPRAKLGQVDNKQAIRERV